MSKIAIMTDSNSGITQEEGKKLGIHVLPMPFLMGEETFFEDMNLTQKDFYEKLTGNISISTSQPSPESILSMFDELLKEYDEVVHIPMSSSLSGSCETAYMLSREYEGRVQVVDNRRISISQRESVLNAISLVSQGKTAIQIKEILEADSLNSSIYVMVDTLEYLKKGGRITAAAAALGTILKLKPVLTFQGDKIDAFAKARTVSQAKKLMVNAIKNDIEARFKEKDNVILRIAYTYDEKAALEWREELKEEFGVDHIEIDPLSLSVACHIGPGALALGAIQKLPTE